MTTDGIMRRQRVLGRAHGGPAGRRYGILEQRWMPNMSNRVNRDWRRDFMSCDVNEYWDGSACQVCRHATSTMLKIGTQPAGPMTTKRHVVFSLVDDDDVKNSTATEIASGFHNDNAYYIGNVKLVDQICKICIQTKIASV